MWCVIYIFFHGDRFKLLIIHYGNNSHVHGLVQCGFRHQNARCRQGFDSIRSGCWRFKRQPERIGWVAFPTPWVSIMRIWHQWPDSVHCFDLADCWCSSADTWCDSYIFAFGWQKRYQDWGTFFFFGFLFNTNCSNFKFILFQIRHNLWLLNMNKYKFGVLSRMVCTPNVQDEKEKFG